MCEQSIQYIKHYAINHTWCLCCHWISCTFRRFRCGSCGNWRRSGYFPTLVTLMTLCRHAVIRDPVALACVHLPTIPVVLETSHVVILVILNPATLWILELIRNYPRRVQVGRSSIRREVEMVHVLVQWQGVKSPCPIQPETSQRFLLMIKARTSRGQQHSGTQRTAYCIFIKFLTFIWNILKTFLLLFIVKQIPRTLQVVLKEAAVLLSPAVHVVSAVLQDLPGALAQLTAGREEAARVFVFPRDNLQQHRGPQVWILKNLRHYKTYSMF